MFKYIAMVLTLVIFVSPPVEASKKKTRNAALVGAGVGLITVGGSGAVKGSATGNTDNYQAGCAGQWWV